MANKNAELKFSN